MPRMGTPHGCTDEYDSRILKPWLWNVQDFESTHHNSTAEFYTSLTKIATNNCHSPPDRRRDRQSARSRCGDLGSLDVSHHLSRNSTHTLLYKLEGRDKGGIARRYGLSPRSETRPISTFPQALGSRNSQPVESPEFPPTCRSSTHCRCNIPGHIFYCFPNTVQIHPW